MCILCDGGSPQDLLEGFRSRIAEFGFTMVSVGDGTSSWTYTIGLLENFAHPEFVVTGLDPGAASDVITGLVQRVRDGESFTGASPDSSHRGVALRFGDVHRTQWTHGRFAMWEAHYDLFGGRPLSRSATQILWPNDDGVFPPDRDFCHAHRNCQPVLSVITARDVNRSRSRSKRRKKRR
jgi:hypothetical protein